MRPPSNGITSSPASICKTAFPSFNGSFRDESLNETLFSSLAQACADTTKWKGLTIETDGTRRWATSPQWFAIKMAMENQPHEARFQKSNTLPKQGRKVGLRSTPSPLRLINRQRYIVDLVDRCQQFPDFLGFASVVYRLGVAPGLHELEIS